MADRRRSRYHAFACVLSAGVAVCALVSAGTLAAQAQTSTPVSVDVPEGTRLLLAADELTYDNDRGLVVASGGVQIDYGPYKLVAERVEYNQETARLRAIGQVELIEPNGNRVFADELDLTDDFANGFVNALRIETPDRTRLAAESAERSGGVINTFNNGVYTACEPCAEDPTRAPAWQIKARKVIQNGETKTIRLEKATFELFGMPIATLPYLEIPDHTVKRKSGFLTPSYSTSDAFGVGITTPYYLVFSPSADATITPTYYTRQGLLGEVEFRQRFQSGWHTLRVAGISQQDPSRFRAGSVDASETERGMINSSAAFKINPRWTFGWDIFAQTDNNFARSYGLEDFSTSVVRSQVWLTGLAGRSHFDLRGTRFDIQDGSTTNLAENQQALVLPSFDYSRSFLQENGSDISLTLNGRALSRKSDDIIIRQFSATSDRNNDAMPGRRDGGGADLYAGFAGDNARISAELEWKKQYALSNGLVLTPMLAARGSLYDVNVDNAPTDYDGTFAGNGTHATGMVTAGLEASYPLLLTTANSQHVIEPVAQVFVRPDEQLSGGLPNEDAQSFLFDAASLFERDKFSGFDRTEGGTRANVGLRYTGTYDNGTKTQAIFGQSYHLAGLNSFATPDLARATRGSGLEDDVSDFVGLLGFSTASGFSLSTSARFDKDDFRAENLAVSAGFSNEQIRTSLTYTDAKASRDISPIGTDRRELSAFARVNLNENWSVSGQTSYDLVDDKFNRIRLGLQYADECTAFTLAYEELRDDNNIRPRDWSIGARLSFRTLGGIGAGSVEAPGLPDPF